MVMDDNDDDVDDVDDSWWGRLVNYDEWYCWWIDDGVLVNDRMMVDEIEG